MATPLSPQPELSLTEIQRSFARHLRDPEQVAVPEGLDARRVGVYRELVFNNISSLLSGFFPVIFSLVSDDKWNGLIAEFIREFQALTPYFPRLPEEFICFLSERDKHHDEPDFLLELAHYEWIELSLFMSEEECLDSPLSEGLRQDAPLRLSSLAIPLAYHYPVHQISLDNQPAERPVKPSYLLVFRNAHDDVCFYELQSLSYQLLLKIEDTPGRTAVQWVETLALESGVPCDAGFICQGLSLIETFQQLGVISTA